MANPPKFDGDDVSRQKLQAMARDPAIAEAMGRPGPVALSGEVVAGKPAFLNTKEYDLGRQIMRGEAAPLAVVPERAGRGQPAGPPAPSPAEPSTTAPRPEAPPPEERPRAGGGRALLAVGLAVFLIVAVFVITFGVYSSKGTAPSSAPPSSGAATAPLPSVSVAQALSSKREPAPLLTNSETAPTPSTERSVRPTSELPVTTQSTRPPPSAITSPTPPPSTGDGLMFKPK